ANKLAGKFLNMSYNQINWRAADSHWSIGESLEHLIRTNAKYIPVYKKNLLPDKRNNNINFKQSFVGKLILKTVKPDYKKKFKTPASFNPIGSTIKETIVNDFINQTNEIAELAEKINPISMKEKITSPFSKLVKYNIGDSLLIIAYHNLRHLQQAERVKSNQHFPVS
ncbi:MAG TPA: DinB family protein, partial [Ignavibacteriaceae bacterium]|nr:DinB family protein [Ignavibacteriaceae bacterium]